MTSPGPDIEQLSTEEQLELLERLWTSLSKRANALPLTDAQREELDRRLDELEQDGPVGIPWEDVVQQIQRSRRT